MSEKTWEIIKLRYCHHVGDQVGLEAELVYPAEHLPDQGDVSLPTVVRVLLIATSMIVPVAPGPGRIRQSIRLPNQFRRSRRVSGQLSRRPPIRNRGLLLMRGRDHYPDAGFTRATVGKPIAIAKTLFSYNSRLNN